MKQVAAEGHPEASVRISWRKVPEKSFKASPVLSCQQLAKQKHWGADVPSTSCPPNLHTAPCKSWVSIVSFWIWKVSVDDRCLPPHVQRTKGLYFKKDGAGVLCSHLALNPPQDRTHPKSSNCTFSCLLWVMRFKFPTLMPQDGALKK